MRIDRMVHHENGGFNGENWAEDWNEVFLDLLWDESCWVLYAEIINVVLECDNFT